MSIPDCYKARKAKMHRSPVEMRLDGAAEASQSPLLSIVTASICRKSFLVSAVAEQDMGTPPHKGYHYQQLISTPFGLSLQFHLADASFSLSRSVKQFAEEGIAEISIPLVMHCTRNHAATIPEVLTEQIAFLLVLHRYLRWMLDVPDFTPEETPEGLAEMMGAVLARQRERFDQAGL